MRILKDQNRERRNFSSRRLKKPLKKANDTRREECSSFLIAIETAKMKYFVSLIFFSVYLNVILTQDCPAPNVHKRTIIRSATSIENGAELLHKLTVPSARDCYKKCCSLKNCNVAVMHYKEEFNEVGEETMEKYCFLFDCKSPSVCSYEQHSRYAIIEIPEVDTPLTTTETSFISLVPYKPSTTTTEIPLESHHDEEQCPPGVPVAMCAADPCQVTSCESHKNAICKPNYCGGCNANFYDKSGKKLQCSEGQSNGETLVVASTNYEETPVESLPPASLKSNKEKGEDPYYQPERRKWIDGTETGHLINASIPRTESPTKKTTTVDNQKEKVIFVNNSFMSIPLLIALCICIMLIVGLIYRFRCARRGKPKKFPVDDGDYLINGMYL